MMHEDALTQRILIYIKEHPGCGRADISRVLPSDVLPNTISGNMANLRRGGAIRREGWSRGAKWYPVTHETKPEYQKAAKQLLHDMTEIHHTKREEFLAARLQELFSN